MRYRVGRHNPHLVYSEIEGIPGVRGTLPATCFTAGVAEQIVKALNAREVEGSTPLDSPAPANEAIVHRCPPSGSSVMPCCGRTPFEAPGDRITVDPALVTCAAPAGEVVSVTEGWTRGLGESQDWENGDVVVSVPPPDDGPVTHYWMSGSPLTFCGVDAHDDDNPTTEDAGTATCSACRGTAGESPLAQQPTRVPPPVDALLKLVDEFGREAHAYGLGDDSFGDTMTDSWKEINSRVRALWATGVEEGRRQRDADIHASVFTSARLAAAEAGFAPAPESVTVSYERRASAYEEGIYDAGIAEGRRQATEERTEEQQGDDRG